MTDDPRWFPDLSRTEAAIAAHDAAWEAFHAHAVYPLTKELAAEEDRLEALARAVGTAFAQETADRNDPKTVERLIRPGPPTAAPGGGPSFVRRCVARWKAGKPSAGGLG